MISRLLGFQLADLSPRERMLLGAALVALLVALVVSASDIAASGGVDLRARVVAARTLMGGGNPYAYGAELPVERLIDPQGVYPGPSRATYPPTLVALYGLVAWLPYGVLRWLWAGLEWGALLLAIVVGTRVSSDRKARVLWLAGALLCFVAGYFWRFHVERGQYYVFIALAVMLDSVLLLRGSRVAGLPIGLAAAVRPSLAALVLLLGAAGWVKPAARGLGIAGAVVLVVTLIFGVEPWIGYREVVGHWTAGVAGLEPIPAIVREPGGAVPLVLEGWDFAHELPARTANTTVLGILAALDPPWIGSVDRWCKLLALTGLAATFGWCLVRRSEPPERRLLACLVAVSWVDFLVPIRHSYADVLVLPAFALALPMVLAWPERRRLWIGIAAFEVALLTLQPLEGGAVSMLRAIGMWAVLATVVALPNVSD